ncbi:MAG: AAA family ATPase, partial [Planctomycetes bacterium]|nr:AAA family ATPase [Planctomycetota bacterium]
MTLNRDQTDDVAMVRECQETYERLRQELAKSIVGQCDVIEQVLIALLAGGHALLEGVPGLAKTLLVSSLSKSLDLSFKRIQFTPDLMPSDVTGADVIQDNVQTRSREFRFLAGPLFANLILADEINRTP